MCSETTFRSWQAKCITKLLLIENVHLSLLIIEDTSNQSSTNENHIPKSISHESKNEKISSSKIIKFIKKMLNFLITVRLSLIYMQNLNLSNFQFRFFQDEFPQS